MLRRTFATFIVMLAAFAIYPALTAAQAQTAADQNTSKAITKCSQMDSAYTRTANDTGGQAFAFAPMDKEKAFEVIGLTSVTLPVNLFSLNNALPGEQTKVYKVPVDLSVSLVRFTVACASSVTIKRPDGSIVQTNDTGVRSVSWSMGSVSSIDAPETGDWSLEVSSDTAFSIRVTGKRKEAEESVPEDQSNALTINKPSPPFE